MTVYQFRTSVTTAAGATSTTSLNVPGGICRQVLIIANTSTTVFISYITDSNGIEVSRYGLQTGELNDITAFPMSGRYTVNITNASPDDTFKIYFAVEE